MHFSNASIDLPQITDNSMVMDSTLNPILGADMENIVLTKFQTNRNKTKKPGNLIKPM